jgi:peptidyl-prolyl cis-trans isomerase D
MLNMLEKIRESTKGWFAWVVIVTLAVVFALWGVYGYMGVNSAESQMAVTVNGRDISRMAVERLSQQLQTTASTSGETLESPEAYRQQALEQLIMQTLLVQDAQKHGFVADKKLVDQFLLTQPEFQSNGVFSPELFDEISARSGLDPYELRRIIGDDIIVEQLRVGIMGSAFILPNEVTRFLTLQNQTRDVQYLTFSSDSFASTRDITEDEIKKYYDNNRAEFQIPEEVSIDYIELNASDIAKSITLSDADIQAAYEQNKAAYTIPEQREVRHILLALPANATVEQMDAAIDQGNKIKEEIIKGTNFGELVVKYSSDAATLEKGGNLGWMGMGVLPPELDKEVFSAKQYDVVGPTLTPFGVDIAQVIGIKPAQVQALSAVRPALVEQLKEQQVQQRFVEWQDQLATLSYEIPDTLKDVSDTMNLPIHSTALFSREQGNDNMITQAASVRAAAFSEAVLAGENSPVLSLAPEHVLVLRIREHRAAEVKPLETVRPTIIASIQSYEGQQKLQVALDSWIPQLENGEITREEVAQQVKGQWQSAPQLARAAANSNVPRLVHDYAFNLSRPVPPKASFGWLPLDSKQFALVAVDKVNQGNVPAIDAPEVVGTTSGLTMLQQQQDYMVYLEYLQKNAEIKYH